MKKKPVFTKCCGCGSECWTVNLVLLPFRSPEPDGEATWGCHRCGLPLQGAVAALCDRCFLTHGITINSVCVGRPEENRRIPTEWLTEPFDHDMTKHPEGRPSRHMLSKTLRAGCSMKN
jgi:hypothetical protein